MQACSRVFVALLFPPSPFHFIHWLHVLAALPAGHMQPQFLHQPPPVAVQPPAASRSEPAISSSASEIEEIRALVARSKQHLSDLGASSRVDSVAGAAAVSDANAGAASGFVGGARSFSWEARRTTVSKVRGVGGLSTSEAAQLIATHGGDAGLVERVLAKRLLSAANKAAGKAAGPSNATAAALAAAEAAERERAAGLLMDLPPMGKPSFEVVLGDGSMYFLGTRDDADVEAEAEACYAGSSASGAALMIGTVPPHALASGTGSGGSSGGGILGAPMAAIIREAQALRSRDAERQQRAAAAAAASMDDSAGDSFGADASGVGWSSSSGAGAMAAVPRPLSAPAGSSSGSSSGSGSSSSVLWVDKYAPRSFAELLSSEAVNRTVLRWVLLWNERVFTASRARAQRSEAANHARAAATGGSGSGAGAGTLAIANAPAGGGAGTGAAGAAGGNGVGAKRPSSAIGSFLAGPAAAKRMKETAAAGGAGGPTGGAAGGPQAAGAAAMPPWERQRVLLLCGPPGAGKTTLVSCNRCEGMRAEPGTCTAAAVPARCGGFFRFGVFSCRFL